MQQLLQSDPEFVAMKRFGYAAAKLLERYPDGCPDHVIAQALLLTEDGVQGEYERIVGRLRRLMQVST